MARHRVFRKKVFCGNCGRRIMNITLETWHDAHMQSMELLYNCELCSTPGTGRTTLSRGDIYDKINTKVDKEAIAMMQAIAPGATIS